MQGLGTGTVKITEIDETVRALEAVQYILETRYNLISIRVLDEKGCRIQMQQSVVTVSQGDMIILKGEKCEGLYKLKKNKLNSKWSFRDKLRRELIARWSFNEDCDGT